MKFLYAWMALLLLILLAGVPARAFYLNRNSFGESAPLRRPVQSVQPVQLVQPARRLSDEGLRQLVASFGRERRSRLPLCKRVRQELPPICADDVECQRHYLQYVNNMVRMLDAGRRRR